MLLTRCPECDTTFRVTDETLKKASGQVRCGRCASVFNAYAELHDPGAKSFEAEPPPRAADKPAAAPPKPPLAAVAVTAATGARPSAADSASTLVDGAAAAAVGAEAKSAEADAQTAPSARPDALAISATEVDRVLNVDPPVADTPYTWSPLADAPRQPRSRWWSVAAVFALLALFAQGIHHFRSDLVGHATFGPWLAATYDALGSEITPRWDLKQYEILDWIATAEPNERGLGSLKITARIQNRSASQQPFPVVHLRLKDRYDAAVASRMFAPAEYLPRDAPRGRYMSPRETARAEIEIVDPGPNASGFELDVCIEVEASLVTCRDDKVFL